MICNDSFYDELQAVSERLLKANKHAIRLMNDQTITDERINDEMDDLMVEMENGCIAARRILEKYRPLIPLEQRGGKLKTFEDIIGSVEVTPEMRVHIKLNTLLPHCKYKTTNYLQDIILRLLESYPGTLPKYDKAFLAIVEHCNHTNRNAYDQDNKGWKQIPNALKGILFDDDDQFNLSLGLFSVYSDEPACHIYVMPIESASDFMFFMGGNVLSLR